jgi:hypothetical protein
VAPAPIISETKKETAKVQQPATPASKVIPQATVQLQRKPEGSTPKSVSTNVPLTVVPGNAAEPAGAGEVSPIIGIAALVVSLAALGIQLWMMLG